MTKCPHVEGHWYMDSARNIYIVPNEVYGLADTYGPDGEMLDKIDEHYRGLPVGMNYVDQQATAAHLGLEWVPSWQRRGNIESGFFAA